MSIVYDDSKLPNLLEPNVVIWPVDDAGAPADGGYDTYNDGAALVGANKYPFGRVTEEKISITPNITDKPRKDASEVDFYTREILNYEEGTFRTHTDRENFARKNANLKQKFSILYREYEGDDTRIKWIYRPLVQFLRPSESAAPRETFPFKFRSFPAPNNITLSISTAISTVLWDGIAVAEIIGAQDPQVDVVVSKGECFEEFFITPA